MDVQNFLEPIEPTNFICRQLGPNPQREIHPPIKVTVSFDRTVDTFDLSTLVGMSTSKNVFALGATAKTVLVIPRTLFYDENDREDPEPYYPNANRDGDSMIDGSIKATEAFEAAGLLTCGARSVQVQLANQNDPKLQQLFPAYIATDFRSLDYKIIASSSKQLSSTWKLADTPYMLKQPKDAPSFRRKSLFEEGVDRLNPEVWKPLLRGFIDDLKKMIASDTFPPATSTYPAYIAVITDDQEKVVNLRPLFIEQQTETSKTCALDWLVAGFIMSITSNEHGIMGQYNSLYIPLTEELYNHCATTLNNELNKEVLKPDSKNFQELNMECVRNDGRRRGTNINGDSSALTWERICSWVFGFFAWIGSLFQGIFDNQETNQQNSQIL